jgi:hypothetical protein
MTIGHSPDGDLSSFHIRVFLNGGDVMAKRKLGTGGKRDAEPAVTGGPMPAVPPPDDPMRRSESEGDVDSAEAAALRVEAIRRTRLMPSDDESPPDKK